MRFDWLKMRTVFAALEVRCCARSVCMGSGGEEAKAAADFVTDAVSDDGLWKAFGRLGLL